MKSHVSHAIILDKEKSVMSKLKVQEKRENEQSKTDISTRPHRIKNDSRVIQLRRQQPQPLNLEPNCRTPSSKGVTVLGKLLMAKSGNLISNP